MKNFVNKFLIALALTGAFAVPSTVTFAQKMDLGTQARYGSTAWTAALATVPDFTLTGANYINNASVWTYGSNWVATRTITTGSGTQTAASDIVAYTVPSGANTLFGHSRIITSNGTNNVTTLTASRIIGTHQSSGTITTLTAHDIIARTLSPGGAATTITGQNIDLRAAANVTTMNGVRVIAPTVSAGTVTTLNGHLIQNIGNASITTAVGLKVDDFTNSTNMRGIQSSLSSGSGKFNIYADGTADNALAGNVRIGSTTAPTVALDVTGAALISTTLGVTGIQSNSNKIYPGTDAAAAQTAAGLYAGTGAPNNANGANGDFYFRSDGGALTTIYQRRAGAWVGII